jgi:hypothetical protein
LFLLIYHHPIIYPIVCIYSKSTQVGVAKLHDGVRIIGIWYAVWDNKSFRVSLEFAFGTSNRHNKRIILPRKQEEREKNNNMRFTATAAVAVAFVAHHQSAILGEGHRKLIDSKNRRREAFFTKATTPLWQTMKTPSIDDGVLIPDEHECDLDIGILECDRNQVCVPNDRSKRGGVCRSKLPANDHRELEPNATESTNYTEFCLMEAPIYNCTCAKFDLDTYDGEISCTNTTWCDYYNASICGRFYESYYVGSGASYKISGCVQVLQERICYSVNIDPTTGEYEGCSGSINGCDCACEVTSIGCDENTTTGLYFSCPNNVSGDACGGVGPFLNKVESCEIIPDTSSSSRFNLYFELASSLILFAVMVGTWTENL